MQRKWLTYALGCVVAASLSLAASACPYRNTSAANDAPPPTQSAAAGQNGGALDN